MNPILHVVLFEPEIPLNTGSIGRTCVAAGAKLWLVRPLGFRIDDRRLRRAVEQCQSDASQRNYADKFRRSND